MAITFDAAEIAWLEADRGDVNDQAVWDDRDERNAAWTTLAMSMNELGRTRAWHEMTMAECWWFYETITDTEGPCRELSMNGLDLPDTLYDALLLIAAAM